MGADVNKVRKGIGSDKRIGYSFIYPGCGYGGSCFPKDVKALVRTAAENGYEAQLLSAVEDVNYMQKHVLTTKVKEHFGTDLSGRTFAVWGLAFKPDTDDMREASAITLINDLTSAGAKVQAYDPKAMEEAKKCYLKGNEAVSYVEGKYDALKGADALILVTEWKEFRSPDFEEIKKALKTPVIFDGRNIYGSKVAKSIIGEGTEIHGDVENSVIGSGVTIGKGSIVKNSIIMNGAVIGCNCVIGAGALVTGGTIIPDNCLALGSPARVIRKVTDEDLRLNRIDSDFYIQQAASYMAASGVSSSAEG